jgi:hypothetical protein
MSGPFPDDRRRGRPPLDAEDTDLRPTGSPPSSRSDADFRIAKTRSVRPVISQVATTATWRASQAGFAPIPSPLRSLRTSSSPVPPGSRTIPSVRSTSRTRPRFDRGDHPTGHRRGRSRSRSGRSVVGREAELIHDTPKAKDGEAPTWLATRLTGTTAGRRDDASSGRGTPISFRACPDPDR